jgi:hypothetical protein
MYILQEPPEGQDYEAHAQEQAMTQAQAQAQAQVQAVTQTLDQCIAEEPEYAQDHLGNAVSLTKEVSYHIRILSTHPPLILSLVLALSSSLAPHPWSLVSRFSSFVPTIYQFFVILDRASDIRPPLRLLQRELSKVEPAEHLPSQPPLYPVIEGYEYPSLPFFFIPFLSPSCSPLSPSSSPLIPSDTPRYPSDINAAILEFGQYQVDDDEQSLLK